MITKLGIAVAAVSFLGSMPADAQRLERWIEVVNGGNEAIWSVHITDIDETRNWGRDLLGEYVILPGSSMVVEPYRHRGYCRFDILITYETGTEVPMWDVNLCEEVAIFVNDMGYTQVGY